MADSSSAIAAMLMAQQPKRTIDPADRSRAYAARLMQEGSSMAPVQSAGEGIARALQGLAGGVFAGISDQADKVKRQKTIQGLTAALGAPNEAGMVEALKGLGDDESGILAPVLATMAGQKMADLRAMGLGGATYDASRPSWAQPTPGAVQPGMGGGQPTPLTINMTPQGAIPPGGFANNLGNIRASGAPWEGKGAPQNGFETFATPEQGAKAQYGNFQAYAKANPTMTVAQALSKWAPPSENNTPQYISTIVENSGVHPGIPLADALADPGTAAALMDAQARIEKGGLPPGTTADTFMTAAGAPPIGGSAPAAIPTQAPQPGATTLPASTAPPTAAPTTHTNLPPISPAAVDLIRQADQLRQSGTPAGIQEAVKLQQKAMETQASWQQEIAKAEDARAYAEQDFARKQKLEKEAKDPTEFQSKSATFADRMVLNDAILNQTEALGTSTRGRILEATPMVGNMAQSQDYRKFKTAKDNWIAANLRQESGAQIGDKEYADADRQYFPQPNDSPEIIQQKAELRKAATGAMIRGAGDKYKPPAPSPVLAPANTAPVGNIPQPAIDQLRANPGTAAQFDEIFGPGAAARALGR